MRRWLVAMLHGDWGFSFRQPYRRRQIDFAAGSDPLFVVARRRSWHWRRAPGRGLMAAMRPYSIFDQIANTFAFIGFSLPTFSPACS